MAAIYSLYFRNELYKQMYGLVFVNIFILLVIRWLQCSGWTGQSVKLVRFIIYGYVSNFVGRN